MKLLFCLFVYWGLCTTYGITTRRFDHQARGSDFGQSADWELTSRGLVSHIVNLDSLPDVRVAVNNQGEVIVNLRDTSIASGWRPGWFIIASNARQRHGSEVRRVSIVKKIHDVDVISSSKVKVHGDDVSALELMHEAQLLLKYPHTPRREHHHRQKRYVSDLLSRALDRINFHANDTDDVISFNFDPKTGHSTHQYNLYKQPGQEVKMTKVNKGHTSPVPSDADFQLKCIDCFEMRKLGQVVDLQIGRKNKTAHLKKFLMQNDVTAKYNMEFELEFKKALGVKDKILLESTPSTTLRTVPVAVVDEKLPPVQLVLSYSRAVYLEINATTSGPLKYNGKYHINGTYTSTSAETSGMIPKTDVTTTGWTVSDESFTGHSTKPYNISLALYQEVTVQVSVQWSQHDVSLVFTPPEVASFVPLFYARTAQDSLRRCETATLTATGIFKYDKSDFLAKVFHKTIWDVGLRESSVFNKPLTTVTVAEKCTANCFKPGIDHVNTMYSVCGSPLTRIERGDKHFNKLTLVSGDFILFQSEEESSSSWCGKQGRHCKKCVWSDNGDSNADACADRLMASQAAEALTTLGQFAAEEWPNRKVVVIEAWDEPTSHDPHGSHGPTSLHYTGRELQVALSVEHPSKSSTLKTDSSASLMSRLRELATCSGFPFAESKPGYVHVCVKDVTSSSSRKKRSALGPPSASWERDEFLKTMNNIGSGAVPIICKSSTFKGNTYPPGEIRENVINPLLDERDINYRLIQYPYDDVDFKPEGLADDICYKPTRLCKRLCAVSQSTEPWDWCQTRVMSPRMALRLRRLATIVNQKHKGVKVTVSKPTLSGQSGTRVKLGYDKQDMKYAFANNGRVLQLSSSLPLTELQSLAVCAGFDFINKSESSSFEVYVKLQDGYQTTVVPFQHTALLAVHVTDEDVAYPTDLKDEIRKTFLFDGFNDAIPLSEHFKISDFKHVDGRFFRLDPALVDCLELVATDLEEGVKILGAYRNHSVNMRDIDKRHVEERLRLETGQAVYLTTQKDALVKLGQTVLRDCSPALRLQSRALGIGCHSDKMYIDIRPMKPRDILDIAEVWNVDNEEVFNSIEKSMNELKGGGPAIFPLNLKRTCKEPRLGHEYAYYSFNSHDIGFCFHDRESQFCRDTKTFRDIQANNLRDQLMKVAGTTLTRGDLEHHLRTCVYDVCGGCPGKGPTWDKKVEGCVHMLHIYLNKAKNPFKDVVDRAAFFNTDNSDSSVHSLACHDESKCVEDTQIYSLLLPLLTSKYKPHLEKSQEELLYSGEDNPSPLLSLVEQEFAKQVAGVVKVYIESETDMAIMRDIIKVLMIYNRDVTNVEFHLTEDVDEENVISALQRKLEHWAGTTCPKWSRFAVAPYSVQVIPHHRRKRSLERSKSRNEVKKSVKEWELNWIKKM